MNFLKSKSSGFSDERVEYKVLSLLESKSESERRLAGRVCGVVVGKSSFLTLDCSIK